jgi:hypothetical protein
MYVAVEDRANNYGMVLNPDASAASKDTWQTWAVPLTDFNTAPNPDVNMKNLRSFFIGFGQRCNMTTATGGGGTVTFDNLSLRLSTCVPALGPVADFNDDCKVDIYDLDILSASWLAQSRDFNYVGGITAPGAPRLLYTFNMGTVSGDGITVSDQSGNGYEGTMSNNNTALPSTYYEPNGGIDGNQCLNLKYSWPDTTMNHIEVNTAALSFWTTNANISWSMWIWTDVDHNPANYNWFGFFGVDTAAGNFVEIHSPRPNWFSDPLGPAFEIKFGTEYVTSFDGNGIGRMSLDDYSYQWLHYAIVKDGDNNTISVYRDGERIAYKPGSTSPKYIPDVANFRLGARGGNWANWPGKVDNFAVYDYALPEAEVRYLATNGTGLVSKALNNPVNLKTGSSPEVVNFGDIAVLATEWMTEKLWP